MRRRIILALAALTAACSETHAPDTLNSPVSGRGDGGTSDAQVAVPDAQVGGDVCSQPAAGGDCDAYFPRWFHNSESGQCEMFVYGGCGGNANRFDTQAACETACLTTTAAQPCEIDASSDALPGVTLHVEAPRCNFQVGQSGEFHWKLSVAQPIAYQVAESMGCGSCLDWDSTDPGKLITYRIGRDDVRYCECDVGCCAPDSSMAHTLATGNATGTISWPGKQWNGPSDTSEPLGEVFPAGSYDVSVELALPGAGTLVAKLPITVK